MFKVYSYLLLLPLFNFCHAEDLIYAIVGFLLYFKEMSLNSQVMQIQYGNPFIMSLVSRHKVVIYFEITKKLTSSEIVNRNNYWPNDRIKFPPKVRFSLCNHA
jgi:hypothetical protein